MAVQRRDEAVGRDVVGAQRAVDVASEHHPSLLRQRHAGDRFGLAAQLAARVATAQRLEVPELERSVGAGRKQRPAARRERQSAHRPVVAEADVELEPGRELPQVDRAVEVAGGEQRAVRAARQAGGERAVAGTQVDAVAQRLLEVETISREEFEGIFPPPSPKNGGTPMPTAA